jgi:hypothetical protein
MVPVRLKGETAMTKKTAKAETQTAEKNKLIGRLSYLPYGARGYGTSIGPVFSTSNPDCEQVVVESIPLDLIRDIHRGQVGAFFIWERKEKEEAGA